MGTISLPTLNTVRRRAIAERILSSSGPADLFARPSGGERAVTVHVRMPGDALDAAEEMAALARSAGADIVGRFDHRRDTPDPRTFLGRGKVAELAEQVADLGVALVLIDQPLSAAQERNLEADLNCRVLDRTGLILDIFAQRAQTFEGRLQVELAQLKHVSSRLVRGWSHLERQKGGIGLRGPGEKQLEMDRRMISGRIKQIERRLVKVRRNREQGRKARRRRQLPVVSLVGYTNAGKTTLFNALTGSERHAEDRLFATLDTSWRRVDLAPGAAAVISDTVGFISRLPHDLVAAFRSTLEEVSEADLLLHVIDAGAQEREHQIEQVETVLDEIGAQNVPVLRVYNKVDTTALTAGPFYTDVGELEGVRISAQEPAAGLDDLLAAVAARLGPQRVRRLVSLAPEQGKLRSELFRLGSVINESYADNGTLELEVELPNHELERLHAREGLEREVVSRP
ncbi:ribosome rescue GTPase HflX [Halorhodospira halochloris]|uniref:ribosome rescue GTPase HflX n=1 Tax=Halorhodospira halochloris TaxID=1052 RepID=UPI001E2E0845|nr:ribosome rescue GTPase HflX [Halorhodospira halochloris]MCG5548754.1 GTPase HflX [Halorhodospira halochloris]